MRAFVATVQIVIDPKTVGPDAPLRGVTDWTTTNAAADWMSALLSDNDEVMDWGYMEPTGLFIGEGQIDPLGAPVEVIEIPADHEEGDFIALLASARAQ